MKNNYDKMGYKVLRGAVKNYVVLRVGLDLPFTFSANTNDNNVQDNLHYWNYNTIPLIDTTIGFVIDFVFTIFPII